MYREFYPLVGIQPYRSLLPLSSIIVCQFFLKLYQLFQEIIVNCPAFRNKASYKRSYVSDILISQNIVISFLNFYRRNAFYNSKIIFNESRKPLNAPQVRQVGVAKVNLYLIGILVIAIHIPLAQMRAFLHLLYS